MAHPLVVPLQQGTGVRLVVFTSAPPLGDDRGLGSQWALVAYGDFPSPTRLRWEVAARLNEDAQWAPSHL